MEKDFKYEKLLLKYWVDKINSYKNNQDTTNK
jgi:hypothetical protein